jgi:hypothetical protein
MSFENLIVGKSACFVKIFTTVFLKFWTDFINAFEFGIKFSLFLNRRQLGNLIEQKNAPP